MNRLVRNIVFEEDGVLQFWSTDSFNPEPDEVYLERFPDKNPIMLDGSEIPEDAEYNLSWEVDNKEKKVKVNIEKAKEIHKKFLRQEREEFFKEVDNLYIQTLSSNKDDKIVTDRQKYLRDITDSNELKQAKTISELKAVKIKEWTEKPKLGDLPPKKP